jgi:PAS domain S-box-containing protein
MLYLDRLGRIIKINRTGVAVFGFSVEKIVGKVFWDLPGVFSQNNTSRFLEAFKNTLMGKEIKGLLSTLSDESGRMHVMDFSMLPVTEGKEVKHVLIIGKDVTRQKETEEKYRLIAENTSDLIALTTFTLNPTFIYLSPSHKEVVGVNPCDMVNKSVFSRMHPDDVKKLFPLLKKYVKGKKQLLASKDPNVCERFEFRIKDKSGNWRYFECTANIVGDKLLFISRDIDERKKAEEMIKEQNIRLRKLDELKTAFLNVTSHELRTPITAIKGHTQLLLKEALGEIPPSQKKALKVILRNINRLDRLIQDILDVSRLESGTMKFIPEKTDIGAMVEQTIETMQAYANEKGIRIHTMVEEGLPLLLIDKERIKQVLMNILNNAIKYSSNGSIVNVNVRREKEEVLFEVQDFGCGIPKDKHEKIFETFYQVDSDKDRRLKGAGLGLSISRGIVLSHGGRIWVESEVRRGSTFSFTLPVTPVKDAEKRFKDVNLFLLKNQME